MIFQRWLRRLPSGLAMALVTWGGAAWAVPVLSPGGKPGAAASWRTSGDAVLLKLASGFDAKAVASAIQLGVPGAKAKVQGDEVAVSGLPEAQLLTALEKVDAGEANDDVDTMLANLRGGGGDEDGSGSSIRATQAADFSEILGKKEELVTAKVLDVKRQQFPLVFVTVKVGQTPKTAAAHVKTGSKITVLPRVKSRNGVVDPKDETSKLNLGAWYAQPGDTVRLRLEPEAKDDVWVAAAFERVTR